MNAFLDFLGSLWQVWFFLVHVFRRTRCFSGAAFSDKCTSFRTTGHSTQWSFFEETPSQYFYAAIFEETHVLTWTSAAALGSTFCFHVDAKWTYLHVTMRCEMDENFPGNNATKHIYILVTKKFLQHIYGHPFHRQLPTSRLSSSSLSLHALIFIQCIIFRWSKIPLKP